MHTHATAVTKKELVEAHRQAPAGLVFYASLSEIRTDRTLLPYLHLLTRAWQDLNLDGVLCINGLPTLYLAIRKKRVSSGVAADLQRLFWNQGLATVLVVADPVTVRIYSGLARPTEPQKASDDITSLVESIRLTDYTLNIQSFMLQLATGSYYRSNSKHFNAEETVDAYLLNNLRTLRDKLTDGENGLHVETAHTFLARILFVCYLSDRRIIDLGDYEDCRCRAETKLGDMLAGLKTAEEKRRALCGLFSRLKDDFNGSMFEHATLVECRKLSAEALADLTHFLQGHESETGQFTLDFWAYDFRLIPVETISAVYEDFLKREDEPDKRTKGAYYTPRFLAETVVDLALRDSTAFEGKRFLDPACGSGIFLVTIFNRLAAAWMTDHPQADYDCKADALKAILRDHLCGIDINPTACRIACFSLYLAFLDCFDPPDIKEYISRKGKLPSILKYQAPSDNEPLTFPVIHEDNFLKPVHPLPKGFDFVVGNPPWSERGAMKGKHHLFAKKIPEHLAPGGTGCILLPSKTFLNDKTNHFQMEWLQSITLDEVVQLADYSKILFKEAKCPCMIVRFWASKPDLATAVVEYVAPKVTRIDYRDGVIPVAPDDRKEIPLRQVLSAAKHGVAPTIWKQYLWGTPRDIKFLEMLQQMPTLWEITDLESDLRRKNVKQTKRFCAGQGFKPAKDGSQPSDRELVSCAWKANEPFVAPGDLKREVWLPKNDARQIGEHLRSSGCYTDRLYSKPSEELFTPPFLLVNQGFSVCSFFDYGVRFQHSLQSIKAEPGDEDILLFLAAYIRSGLARYFLFHTSANWGVERDKVLLEELLHLPFPLPGSEWIAKEAQDIVAQVASRIREFIKASRTRSGTAADVRKCQAEGLQDELIPLVYRYFDLIDQEVALIEDTNRVAIPSATPGTFAKPIPSRARIQSNSVGPYARGLFPYAETLSRTLNEWAEQSKSKVRASIAGGVHERSDMVCLTVELTSTPQAFRAETPSDETFRTVARLAESAASRVGCLNYLRGIIAFDGPRIHIFKPTALIGWTRTAALNDAAEIYSHIAVARQAMQGNNA